MKSNLQTEVLVLNRLWTAVRVCSAQEAFLMMAAGAATALDSFVPVQWADWLKLPIRENDDQVGTTRGQVRVPRVIVAVNFDKMLRKRLKLNLTNLRKRYKDTCAYTGRKLRPSEMSKEHVLPVSKGGKTTWPNVVLAHRDINSKRGNRSLEEAGLKLKYQPTEPREVPAWMLIENTSGFKEWDRFLKVPEEEEVYQEPGRKAGFFAVGCQLSDSNRPLIISLDPDSLTPTSRDLNTFFSPLLSNIALTVAYAFHPAGPSVFSPFLRA